MRISILLLSWLTVASSALAADKFVYISIAGENRIAIYRLDEAHEALVPRGKVDVSGGPGSLALHPNGEFLLASIRSVGNVASFHIDGETGQLQLINEVNAGADPSYVAVHPSGRYLLCAYYRAGNVTVHEIDSSGKIGRLLQTIPTDEKAHAIVGDRTGNYWFVPHTGPNAIFQFRFDAATGKLSPNDPAKLTRDPNTGPRHLWFHPRDAVAFTSDEQGRSVSAYQFDEAAGTLHLTQTLSTLPPQADRSQGGSTSDIEVHPSGRFVYVANRGHDSIARYGVVSDQGTLRHLGNTPCETTTRSFNVDRSGRWMVAAGQKSGKVIVFAVSESSGDLEPKQTVEVGKAPWWVLIR